MWKYTLIHMINLGKTIFFFREYFMYMHIAYIYIYIIYIYIIIYNYINVFQMLLVTEKQITL